MSKFKGIMVKTKFDKFSEKGEIWNLVCPSNEYQIIFSEKGERKEYISNKKETHGFILNGNIRLYNLASDNVTVSKIFKTGESFKMFKGTSYSIETLEDTTYIRTK